MAVSVNEIRLEPMVVTYNSVDLGATEGVTLNMSTTTTDVTCDQTGSQVRTQIITGHEVTIAMTLKEMSSQNWSTIVGTTVGGEHTPSAGTKLTGLGSASIFKTLSSVANPLILKPVGAADNTRNIAFHKAYPIPESVSYSGTDLSVMSVTFRAIIDSAVDEDIDIMSFGDNTQSLA